MLKGVLIHYRPVPEGDVRAAFVTENGGFFYFPASSFLSELTSSFQSVS